MRRCLCLFCEKQEERRSDELRIRRPEFGKRSEEAGFGEAEVRIPMRSDPHLSNP
jgi:hypothetical protein